jgi:hypothetical protein
MKKVILLLFIVSTYLGCNTNTPETPKTESTKNKELVLSGEYITKDNNYHLIEKFVFNGDLVELHYLGNSVDANKYEIIGNKLYIEVLNNEVQRLIFLIKGDTLIEQGIIKYIFIKK